MSASVRGVFGSALLLLAVLVLGAAAMSVRNNRAFVAVSRDALVSNELLLELELVLSAMRDAETGQRGFLLTGDDAYLQPFLGGTAAVGRHLENIERLSRVRAPGGRPRVPEAATIRRLAERKLGELRTSVETHQAEGRSRGPRPWDLAEGKAVMDSLRQVVGDAERRERTALEDATSLWEQRAGRSLSGVLALAVVGLLLLGLLFWAALRLNANRVAHATAIAGERDALERRVAERTAELEHERRAALDASAQAGVAATRAEEAAAEARRSEARFHAYVDQVKEYAIFNTDGSGRATSWNAGVQRLLGYTEAEFIGLDAAELFTDEARRLGVPERELAEAAAKGSANDDRWMRRKNGEVFYAFGSTTAIHEPDGSLAGFTKVMRDRTEHHLADLALRKSETRYRLVARATREAIRDWDLDTDRLEWNDAIRTLFGYEPGDIEETGRWWRERIHPDDHDAVIRKMESAGAPGGEFWESEYRFRRRDGSYAWVTDRGIVDRGSDGRPTRMLGTLSDVTQRRRAEREARMFVRLVQESRDFIGISTPSGEAFFVNEAGRRLVGLPDMESVRRTRVIDYFPAREQRRVADQILPIVERQGHWSGETVFRNFATGEEIPVQWNVFAIPDLDTGKPLALACVSSDFRERKRGEERLAQAQRMEAIGQLAGGIAHDLNNMLTSILGNATFLQRQLEPSDQRYADAVQIGEAAERSAALTRSLLAFARRDMVQPRLLDLAALLHGMSRMLRPLLGENVELDLRLAPGLPPVFVDRSRMEQVVLNLALNARAAMPQGGVITIHADSTRVTDQPAGLPPGEYVRLSVTDTGVGMDEAVRARIFEPFFTTKSIGEGTGLGLAMVYGSITQAGGTVTVESEPGAGATFHVYLPAARDTAAPEDPVAASPAETRGTGTVLIVEDEETVRDLAARMLENAGYQVLQASDGAQALAVLAERGGDIDLLLTDVVMPGLSGRDLAERVRGSNPGLPVLFMSGYAPDDVVRRGLLQDGAAFLQKPFTPDRLAAQVRQVLDRAGIRSTPP